MITPGGSEDGGRRRRMGEHEHVAGRDRSLQLDRQPWRGAAVLPFTYSEKKSSVDAARAGEDGTGRARASAIAEASRTMRGLFPPLGRIAGILPPRGRAGHAPYERPGSGGGMPSISVGG